MYIFHIQKKITLGIWDTMYVNSELPTESQSKFQHKVLIPLTDNMLVSLDSALELTRLKIAG